jgi:outer membrane receptor for ferrienterochelin and colicins
MTILPISLQDRISIFSKFNFNRISQKNLVWFHGIYMKIDGAVKCNGIKLLEEEAKYMASIYTSRYEFLGKYELPVQEKMYFQLSWSNQNSVYE